jgi:hypothetical protein
MAIMHNQAGLILFQVKNFQVQKFTGLIRA